MPTGLVALLDDIAGLTKLAAASLDDVGAAAGRASVKAAGVVVDDAAVTPRYVTGLKPERELPIIGRIALGSLRNKLLLLLPAALLLSAFAPWAITPILMVGGAYLAFEGSEKLIEAVGGGHHEVAAPAEADPVLLEKATIGGAIRTDLILSAEIMAIALATVSGDPIVTQGVVLAVVGIGITAGVYGAVALIVKMDDVGLHLAQGPSPALRGLGRGLVKAMPLLMSALSVIGTAAMIWVGGGILLHGAEVLGWAGPAHIVHDAALAAGHAAGPLHPAVEWLVGATGAGLVGLVIGGAIALGLHAFSRERPAH